MSRVSLVHLLRCFQFCLLTISCLAAGWATGPEFQISIQRILFRFFLPSRLCGFIRFVCVVLCCLWHRLGQENALFCLCIISWGSCPSLSGSPGTTRECPHPSYPNPSGGLSKIVFDFCIKTAFLLATVCWSVHGSSSDSSNQDTRIFLVWQLWFGLFVASGSNQLVRVAQRSTAASWNQLPAVRSHKGCISSAPQADKSLVSLFLEGVPVAGWAFQEAFGPLVHHGSGV